METGHERFPVALRLAVGDVVLNTSALDANLASFGNAARNLYGEEEKSIRSLLAAVPSRIPRHARHGALLLGRNKHSKAREVHALIEEACNIREKRHGVAHALTTLDLDDMSRHFTMSHAAPGGEIKARHLPLDEAAADLTRLAAAIQKVSSRVMHVGVLLVLRPDGWRK